MEALTRRSRGLDAGCAARSECLFLGKPLAARLQTDVLMGGAMHRLAARLGLERVANPRRYRGLRCIATRCAADDAGAVHVRRAKVGNIRIQVGAFGQEVVNAGVELGESALCPCAHEGVPRLQHCANQLQVRQHPVVHPKVEDVRGVVVGACGGECTGAGRTRQRGRKWRGCAGKARQRLQGARPREVDACLVEAVARTDHPRADTNVACIAECWIAACC